MALSNTQYDAIMHEYEERRSLHRQELEERVESVYETVPWYRELDEETASVSADFGRRRLLGEKLDKSDLQRLLRELAEQKRVLLTEAGYSSDFLDMGYTCQDCRDTGYIESEKCHCFKQKIIETLYDKSNLRTLTKTANFKRMSDRFYKGDDLKRFIGARKAAEDFINNFTSDYQNLFFYGTVGTGKTFMAVSVADMLLKKGHSVIYFSSVGLFELLSENSFDYNNKQELRSLYDDLFECDLLVIDDLGTERVNSFVTSELFSLLNERDARKKSTVITTNCSLEHLQNLYSDRIFSRITSNFKLLKLSGPDIRNLIKIRRKESEELK